MINNEKESYTGRYDFTSVTNKYSTNEGKQWVPYIVKKIAEDKEIDCGMYCEEHKICDFFVHDEDSACYMGTFRNQTFNKNGTDLVDFSTYGSSIKGLSSPYNIYSVWKSKSAFALNHFQDKQIHFCFRFLFAFVRSKIRRK